MSNNAISMQTHFSEKTKEIINDCFKKVVRKDFENDLQLYKTLATYRGRWLAGTLGEKQIEKLLNHFGYELSKKIVAKKVQ